MAKHRPTNDSDPLQIHGYSLFHYKIIMGLYTRKLDRRQYNTNPDCHLLQLNTSLRPFHSFRLRVVRSTGSLHSDQWCKLFPREAASESQKLNLLVWNVVLFSWTTAPYSDTTVLHTAPLLVLHKGNLHALSLVWVNRQVVLWYSIRPTHTRSDSQFTGFSTSICSAFVSISRILQGRV